MPSNSFTCKRGQYEVHLIFSTLQSSEEVKSFHRTSVARKGKAEMSNFRHQSEVALCFKRIVQIFQPMYRFGVSTAQAAETIFLTCVNIKLCLQNCCSSHVPGEITVLF